MSNDHAIRGYQLQALVDCSGTEKPKLLEQLRRIITPMHGEIWKQELADHPDRAFSTLMVQGIEEGFRIGFDPSRAQLQSTERNMLSATEHAQVVSSYLADDVNCSR